MDDLQKSELVISKILTLVKGWGIQSTELRFEELELPNELLPFFVPCIRWLSDEGIIRSGKIYEFDEGEGIVMQPVLTSFGMRVMGSDIQLGESTEKIATAVDRVSSGERSYSQVGDFFGGILGGLTKSLGS
jgi:hypothetical protein